MSLSAIALHCYVTRRHAARLVLGTWKGPPSGPPFETNGEWCERMVSEHGIIPRFGGCVERPPDWWLRPTVDLWVERNYLRRRQWRGERRQRERDRRAWEAAQWLERHPECTSVRAAAGDLGVSERTLHRWLSDVPDARRRLDRRRRCAWHDRYRAAGAPPVSARPRGRAGAGHHPGANGPPRCPAGRHPGNAPRPPGGAESGAGGGRVTGDAGAV